MGGNWTKDALTVMEKVTSGWGQVDDQLTGGNKEDGKNLVAF